MIHPTACDSDVAVEKRRQLRLGQRADLGRFDVAVLEQHQGRNTTHTVLRRGFLVLVDVQFADLQLALLFLGDLVEHRCNHLARAAPLSPIVDQNRTFSLDDVLVEAGVADVGDEFAHEESPYIRKQKIAGRNF